MKKFLILCVLALTLVSVESRSQGFYMGARGGFNLTGITQRTNTELKAGGNFGLFGGYQFSTLVALQVEALYSFQGYRGQASLFPLNTSVNLDYLKIPIMAKIYLIKGLNIEAGVSFNILTSALDGTVPIKGLNGFDFSIPVGIAYQFGRHFEVGLRYDISTVKVHPDLTGTNSVFSVNVGWRFLN